MLFNSENFILIFLVAFLLSYYIAAKRFKKFIIFVYSMVFYAIGTQSLQNIFILIISISVNYLFAFIINKTNDKKKIFLFIFVLLDIISLVFFKLKIGGLLLPLGYSFIVFHFISYLSDLSNGKTVLSFIKYLNYILFFPKLISGPITRYNDFLYDYDTETFDKNNFFIGIFTFSCGLAMKCLLSDNLFYITNQIEVFGYDSISIITAWIGVYAYYLKLYFDFAGYSLMAIGIAKCIGFNLPTNFDTPLASKSISEFWRRWHITLGLFFRDYVYIPLGGNRCNKLRQFFNLLFVWLLTGLWHGFSYNYILWAMIIFIFISFEKFVYKINIKAIGIFLVCIIMPLVFLIFEITDLSDLSVYFTKLINIESFGYTTDLEVILDNYLKIIIISIIFATTIPKLLYKMIIERRLYILMIILSICFTVASLYMIRIGESDTFRYFTF